MPRKTPGKKADDAPAANDTATPLAGHPWFPDTDAAKIVKLKVQRVQTEDRKGLPGAGATGKVLMTPDPIAPAMLTTERQIAEAFGPGYFEVWALDAANRFACGAPFVVQIPDKSGRVPVYVRQFEDQDADEDDGGASEEVRLLKLKLSEERNARSEERNGYLRLIDEMRKNHSAAMGELRQIMQEDRRSLGDLAESINKANADARAHAAPSSGLAAPDWVRERLERIEREAAEARKAAHEMELAKLKAELARRGGHAPADESPREDDWIGQFTRAAPLIEKGMEWLDGLAEKRREAAQAAAKVAQERAAFKLGEHAVPRVEELRRARENGRTVDPAKRLAAVFRELHAAGMLPAAYVTELAEHGIAFGGAADGAPASEAPPSGGDRAAVG